MVTRTKDQNTYSHGNWNAICDECGFKFKDVDIKKRWDGFEVCNDCWEARHPSDFFRAPKEDQNVAWTRVDTEDDAIQLHDDENYNIVYGTDLNIHNWNTPLTTLRVASASAGTAVDGSRITIYRTGGGNFTLIVSAIGYFRLIPENINGVVVLEYNGDDWTEVSWTTLGL